jgi:transcriptional repressor NrdR
MVVKKDKRRELFNPDKLSNGVQRAFEKRPISQKVIEELLSAVEEEIMIHAGEYHEINSSLIGEMIMDRIKKVDSVAYIRFASVYRKFEDVSEFIKEIESINQ